MSLTPNGEAGTSFAVGIKIAGIVAVFLLCLVILRFSCNARINFAVLRDYTGFNRIVHLLSPWGYPATHPQQVQDRNGDEQAPSPTHCVDVNGLLSGLTIEEKQSLLSSLLTNKVATKDDIQKVQQCPICISEIQVNQKISVLSCNHLFHLDCLCQWLSTHTKECPYCRTEILTTEMLEEGFRIRKHNISNTATMEA